MTEEMVQQSAEWFQFKLGKFGASRIGVLTASGEKKGRATLIHDLVCERLSGKPQGWEGNDATASGNEQEPKARTLYADTRACFVVQVGLIVHPTMPFTLASPDGLIDDDGGLEIKSHVKFKTHLSAIEAPAARMHIAQCQWGMACSGRKWWDYGHYCEDAPEHLRLFMFPRVMRDDRLIAELTVAVREAEAEVCARVARWSVESTNNIGSIA